MQLRSVDIVVKECLPVPKAEQHAKLPRLLDLDDSPSVTRRRRYWQYVHRWRRRLFSLWRQDTPHQNERAEIARGVDDLLAVTFLVDYFGRSGWANMPPISEVHRDRCDQRILCGVISWKWGFRGSH